MPHALRRFAACCFCVFVTCVNSFSARAADASKPTTELSTTGAPRSRLTFELDVMPILTSAGCNQGACHGKSRGQNGFALSLLGFDADFDYAAIVEQARGRRFSPAAPEQSLLLAKGAAVVPHGGGERLQVGDKNYDTIRRWIATGLARSTADDPTFVRIDV